MGSPYCSRKLLPLLLADVSVSAGQVLGEGSTDDIDGRTSSTTKLFLLAALTADADLSSGELDEFMTKVRKMAEHLAR